MKLPFLIQDELIQSFSLGPLKPRYLYTHVDPGLDVLSAGIWKFLKVHFNLGLEAAFQEWIHFLCVYSLKHNKYELYCGFSTQNLQICKKY